MARALLGAKPPLLLVIDDLQWVDPETVEWLHYLLRFDPKARLLLVGTVRLEEVDDQHALTALLLQLRRAGQVTELALDRLDAAETAALAAQAANQPLEAKSVTQIYEQTAGNPLFVVEMVRAALRGAEAGQEHQGLLTPFLSGTDFPTHLPPKVQAVLQARLNQLSPPARQQGVRRARHHLPGADAIVQAIDTLQLAHHLLPLVTAAQIREALMASGKVITPDPTLAAEPYVRHTPVAIAGQPGSEIVIEQRAQNL